ncbi:MAG: TIGR00341 family protein [Candidatus Aminicenantes bacterium]|nr:TIGR00341 family protein [Candidatus Aminicenantes bacterium]
MPLRLIEIVVPEKHNKDVQELLQEHEVLELWEKGISEGRIHVEVLIPTGESGKVLDLLEKRFSQIKGFRIILLPVEASIPRPEPSQKEKTEHEDELKKKKPASKFIRISREELYADIQTTVRVSWVFVIMVILSSLVASVGILRNNVVFIIGAMVIAPILGPNVALSFATTLGDIALSLRAAKAIAIGIITALISSILIGVFMHVDPLIPELFLRTQVNLADVVLALAAGSAASLSFSSGLVSALIGVMVAVALLPPLVTLGMLVGSGHWEMALGALLLFLINLICVNLAGVVTFLAQGIRPLTWWEATKAKKATRKAIILWSILLTALVLFILLSQ